MSVGITHERIAPKSRKYEFCCNHETKALIKELKLKGIDLNSAIQWRRVLLYHRDEPKGHRSRKKVFCRNELFWTSTCGLWKEGDLKYKGKWLGVAPLALTTKDEIRKFADEYMSDYGKEIVGKIIRKFKEGTDYVTWA